MEDDCVVVKSKLESEGTARVNYSQITDSGIYTDSEIVEIEKRRSVVGRATVGGLLFGRTGAIVGCMTGLGGSRVRNEVRTEHYLLINYASSADKEPKILLLRFQGWLISRLYDFDEELRRKTGLRISNDNVQL